MKVEIGYILENRTNGAIFKVTNIRFVLDVGLFEYIGVMTFTNGDSISAEIPEDKICKYWRLNFENNIVGDCPINQMQCVGNRCMIGLDDYGCCRLAPYRPLR